MLMDDEHKVENYLLNIGYHRLSAYIYPFYKSPKSDLMLKEGTTFEQVITLYRFDKKLRILLFNEIEKCEVAIICLTPAWVPGFIPCRISKATAA